MTETFVVGDTHGHVDRLEALLRQENLPREGVTLVHVGDIGHFGRTGSPTGDELTLNAVHETFDVVLWGNHDRAIIDGNHYFVGYVPPAPDVEALLRKMQLSGQLRLAYVAHSFLVTHAGLHARFEHMNVRQQLKGDVVEFVEWLNGNDADSFREHDDDVYISEGFFEIRDAIAAKRGGVHPGGGLLWRDANEPLYEGFRQVFGHTSGFEVRRYSSVLGDSYCIDVGNKDNGRLAGVFLPSERIVEVQV